MKPLYQKTKLKLEAPLRKTDVESFVKTLEKRLEEIVKAEGS